jgi:hypothetical protein
VRANDTTPIVLPPRTHLTRELRAERATVRALVERALGPRVRVRVDAEGWPLSPGKYGRVEWRGLEATGPAMGQARIYVFSDHPRMIRPLSAVPGVHRHQVGDREAAFWIAAEDVEGIRAVAGLLRLRVRRPSGAPRPAGFRRQTHDGEHAETPFSHQEPVGHVAIPR